jgi:4-hydroxythreonine-4-phosphate dehydrogenase
MRPLLVSSGEPAGIGPDLCIALAEYNFPLVLLGDKVVLEQRAKTLKKTIKFVDYKNGDIFTCKKGELALIHTPTITDVVCGQLNPANSEYVLNMLTLGARLCEQQKYSALVTAPVHKAVINKAGFNFTGHTEFFSHYFNAGQVVMMLACPQMKVALVTTHLPLKEVAAAITQELIINVIRQVNATLTQDFGICNPVIKVAGLNPHAGESGYLGREEIEVILPALHALKELHINVQGPFPADTMFIQDQVGVCDAYVVMYHDQGLPVLKYAGFSHAVNITLGLPIIRTSVDHGTALDLAGTDRVDSGSMLMAIETALTMAKGRGGCD